MFSSGNCKRLNTQSSLLFDLKENLREKHSFLRDVFVIHGYPLHLVSEAMNCSWAKDTKNQSFEITQHIQLKKSKDQNTTISSMHHISKVLQIILKETMLFQH